MSALWNTPFAASVVLALWIRLGAGPRTLDALAPVLGFFGIEPWGHRRALVDWLGTQGVVGLLFVAWSPRMDANPDIWLAIDAIATAIGAGLLFAWVVHRLTPAPEM